MAGSETSLGNGQGPGLHNHMWQEERIVNSSAHTLWQKHSEAACSEVYYLGHFLLGGKEVMIGQIHCVHS